jgi:hypothetical protein
MRIVFRNGVAKSVGIGLLLCLTLALGGCAAYEAHYSRFEAANSAGESRSFLLSWQTKRYPEWALGEDIATAVQLQTQCSDRVWVLRDETTGACDVKAGAEAQEAAGIRACGEPGADLDWRGRPIREPGYQCMSLTDGDGSRSSGSRTILELERDVQLTVGCYPDATERQVDDEIVNSDYLKASVVPYSIRTRTAPLYSLSERPPALDDKVCDDE